jgi:membrane fusion protein (multidrug efflux system)
MAIQRLLGLSAVMLSLCLSGEEQGAVTASVAGAPPSVCVAAATLREVTPSMDLVARVEAIDAVDLLARVS